MILPDQRQSRGKAGEEMAAHDLQRRGYQIIQRNYRCRLGEIDLIAEKDGALFFIEVKTRTSDYFGLPQENVGWRKQGKSKKSLLITCWKAPAFSGKSILPWWLCVLISCKK